MDARSKAEKILADADIEAAAILRKAEQTLQEAEIEKRKPFGMLMLQASPRD